MFTFPPKISFGKIMVPDTRPVKEYTGTDKLNDRLVRGDGEEGSRRVAAGSEATEDARRDTEPAGPRTLFLTDTSFLTLGILFLTFFSVVSGCSFFFLCNLCLH